MGVLGIVLAVVVGLVGGVAAGFVAGSAVRGSAKRYWALNAVALLVGMAANFAGLMTKQQWLSYGAIGLLGGVLTGLKYGYSDSTGVWRRIEAAEDKDASPAEPPQGAREDDPGT